MMDRQLLRRSHNCLEEEAQNLLLKVLKTPGALLDIPGGEATRKLAKQILLRNPAVSEVPQWQLVTDLDDVALYEAIEEHVAVDLEVPANESEAYETSQLNTGEVSSTESLFALEDSLGEEVDGELQAEQQSAKLVCMLGLIADERTDDAVKVAQSHPHGRYGAGVAWERAASTGGVTACGRVCGNGRSSGCEGRDG